MIKANRRAKNGDKAATSEQAEEIPGDVVIDENALHTLGYALRPMRKGKYLPSPVDPHCMLISLYVIQCHNS